MKAAVLESPVAGIPIRGAATPDSADPMALPRLPRVTRTSTSATRVLGGASEGTGLSIAHYAPLSESKVCTVSSRWPLLAWVGVNVEGYRLVALALSQESAWWKWRAHCANPTSSERRMARTNPSRAGIDPGRSLARVTQQRRTHKVIRVHRLQVDAGLGNLGVDAGQRAACGLRPGRREQPVG